MSYMHYVQEMKLVATNQRQPLRLSCPALDRPRRARQARLLSAPPSSSPSKMVPRPPPFSRPR